MIEVVGISELRSSLQCERGTGQAINKKVALVPTMGFLHEGHLSLIREAKKYADIIIVSIFVNPIQFSPQEDLASYPRDVERDRAMLHQEDVDYLFVPNTSEMYPDDFATFIDVEGITEMMCGANRPGHYRGVATVVVKLLNIVQPEVAIFGQKDWQQLTVIQRCVKDLNIGTEIIGAPIVREADGLAMSSRNTYLSPEDRNAALILNKSLQYVQKLVTEGERNSATILRYVYSLYNEEPLVTLEYFDIRDPDTLKPVEQITENVLVAVAARVGKARLIDNAIIHP